MESAARKDCRRCGTNLPLTSFSPRKDAKDGLAYWCMSCKAAATKASPRRKAVVDAYRGRNRVECLVRTKVCIHRERAGGGDELDDLVLEEALRLTHMRAGAWEVDHIVPVSKGGKNRHDNLQVVPAGWNKRKWTHAGETFFPHPRGITRA